MSSTLARLIAEVRESFAMALGALAAHKLRSCLTLLGVLVGVFSIIVVMTAIRVMQNNIERELGQLGTHTFSIQKFPPIFVESREGWEKIYRRKNISWQHFQLLKQKVTLADSMGVECYFTRDVALANGIETNPDVAIIGASPEWFAAKNLVIEQGRPLMPSDLDSSRSVCVLGNDLAKKLFPHSPALGDKVKFRGINYRVVGILERRGTMSGGDQDNFLVIPVTAGLDRFGGAQWRTLTILVQAPNALQFEDAMEQARGALRAIRKVPPGELDDFELFTNDSVIQTFRNVTFAVRLGAAVISSIALLAAGIGIMNIMLVSVTERTREIGIRRAVGAKKRNILTQFIIEAIVLCELGGVAGVLLGVLGGNITAWLLKLPPAVPLDWAGFGLLICSIVGVIFGSYPAFKAAHLDPIESLRYE